MSIRSLPSTTSTTSTSTSTSNPSSSSTLTKRLYRPKEAERQTFRKVFIKSSRHTSINSPGKGKKKEIPRQVIRLKQADDQDESHQISLKVKDRSYLIQTFNNPQPIFFTSPPASPTQASSTSTTMDPISPVAQNLRIIILGSGIAGLSTALSLARRGFKDITVIEQARDLTFVGVGIQVAPNMARVLDRLRVWDAVLEDAVELKATSIRRGTTGESLADLNLPNIRAKYGYPHMVAHRASLIDALYRPLITEYASCVKFILNHRVRDVNFEKTSIFAFNREGNEMTLNADIIIAADGIKSKARYLMMKSLGEDDQTIETGTAAYRITIAREKMLADPELRKLIDSNTVYRWIGTRRHIIGYPIHRNTLFNISTAHPDINFAQSDNWTSTGTKAGMKKVFADYCELIHKLLDLAPENGICEWKLVMHANIKNWVHGNVALAGDACHATLPHLAQGAAQAIEDGAVIAACLARLQDKSDIHKCLKVYERVRKHRAEEMVQKAANSGRDLHLVISSSAGQRDDRGRRVNVGGDVNADKVSDMRMQESIYGHDCVAYAEKEFDRFFAEVEDWVPPPPQPTTIPPQTNVPTAPRQPVVVS